MPVDPLWPTCIHVGYCCYMLVALTFTSRPCRNTPVLVVASNAANINECVAQVYMLSGSTISGLHTMQTHRTPFTITFTVHYSELSNQQTHPAEIAKINPHCLVCACACKFESHTADDAIMFTVQFLAKSIFMCVSGRDRGKFKCGSQRRRQNCKSDALIILCVCVCKTHVIVHWFLEIDTKPCYLCQPNVDYHENAESAGQPQCLGRLTNPGSGDPEKSSNKLLLLNVL